MYARVQHFPSFNSLFIIDYKILNHAILHCEYKDFSIVFFRNYISFNTVSLFKCTLITNDDSMISMNSQKQIKRHILKNSFNQYRFFIASDISKRYFKKFQKLLCTIKRNFFKGQWSNNTLFDEPLGSLSITFKDVWYFNITKLWKKLQIILNHIKK